MKIFVLPLLMMISSLTIAQSFSIDDIIVNIEGNSSETSIANNTFLNAQSTGSIQWSIVDVSLPAEWDFSNCFPNCYQIGETSGTLSMLEGESYYLNCHIYPNNIHGEGSVKMAISDNMGLVQEVTWQVVVGSVSVIENDLDSNKKQIKSIYTQDGRLVNEFITNQIHIVVYEDGSIKQICVTP